MDGKPKEGFYPNPLKWMCPKCKSYYREKTPVFDYNNEDFVAGLLATPPIIMTLCHGKHPIDPYQEKK
jgi:hypothetical protein